MDDGIEILLSNGNKHVMATKTTKKPGPKDRSYVNSSQKHEVAYESKRKSPAKKFGSKRKSA